MIEELCIQEKEGSITFSNHSCQEEGATSWSNPWPPTASDQHQLLPMSLIIPIRVTKVGLSPSCLGLQHPHCTGRYYCSMARQSFTPLQCQGSTHCSQDSLLDADTLSPHIQQDQQHGELGEIFAGQNWFRWDLIGAAWCDPRALWANWPFYRQIQLSLTSTVGQLRYSAGKWWILLSLLGFLLYLLLERNTHKLNTCIIMLAGSFNTHNNESNIHSSCTLQKKHMLFVDWKIENWSIPALLTLQAPDSISTAVFCHCLQ